MKKYPYLKEKRFSQFENCLRLHALKCICLCILRQLVALFLIACLLDLQFKVDFEPELLPEIRCEEVAEKIYFYISFCQRFMTWGLNRVLTFNTSTRYLLDYEDFQVIWILLQKQIIFRGSNIYKVLSLMFIQSCLDGMGFVTKNCKS